jgi:lysine decarboxylase
MPGHGQQERLGPNLSPYAQLDFTELPGLDDWHAPEGCIREAEELLAAAYQAADARMVVNGSSGGITGLIVGAFHEGDKLLLPRNAHRSFFTGLVLSGAEPIYLPARFFGDWPAAFTPAEEVLAALNQYQDIQGVFLVDPTVYGASVDLQAIAGETRRRKLLFFVDQAHGAHFAFHEGYPVPALAQGADAVVYGMHKTLPVLTPGAAVVFSTASGSWVKSVKRALSLITTTSPPYPLLASLDWGRAFMQREGRDYLERARDMSRRFQQEINAIPGIRVLYPEYGEPYDYLKVVFMPDGLSLNGYQLAERLRLDDGIQVEMVQERAVTAMMSLLHPEAHWMRLLQALQRLACAYTEPKPALRPPWSPPIPPLYLTPRQAWHAPKRRISLQHSVGTVCGQMVVPYPPGIPALLPGEVISAEMVDYIVTLRDRGHHFQGIEADKIKFIDIIEMG